MKIEDWATKIRDLFNSSVTLRTGLYLQKNDGAWDQFCAALDTIEDTCLAIENFQKTSETSFRNNPYLTTYGLLQVLVVQQDAVNFLKTSLLGVKKRILWADPEYSDLWTIRQVRNETVGHPIKTEQCGRGKSQYTNDEVTSCTINRSSLSKDGFRYILWRHSGTVAKTVVFSETLAKQERILGEVLKSVLEEMQQLERQHKERFKGQSLGTAFQSSDYQLSLVRRISSGHPMGWSSLDSLYKEYEQVKVALEERFGKLNQTLNVPGTKELLKELDYVFSKIESFKMSGYDDIELVVYVDALIARIDEFKTHLKETDKVFEL